MKIAITGGKGGAGKSTISTALAVELAKKYKVILVDADVECPDDHIILSIKREKVTYVKAFLPLFNQKKCLKCGKCNEVCKENAIIIIQNNYPLLIEGQCNGCGACLLACLNKAISKNSQIIGTIYQGKPKYDSKIFENLILISGEININCESSSPVVKATCRFATSLEGKYDFILIDTAVSTHFNVITALKDVNMALGIVEPTPLEKHDLEIILKLLKILKIESSIIVNKANVGDLSLINEIERNYNVKIISEIPYTKKIIKSYSKDFTRTHKKISEIVEYLERSL